MPSIEDIVAGDKPRQVGPERRRCAKALLKGLMLPLDGHLYVVTRLKEQADVYGGFYSVVVCQWS